MWTKLEMCVCVLKLFTLCTYSGQRFRHVTRCLSSCRWLCSSTSRTKMSSRSFMRRCWPNVWSTRTAPATTPRPAWSPNSRWDLTQSACVKNTHSNSEHVRLNLRLFLSPCSKRAASSTRPNCSGCSRTSASVKTWTSSSRNTWPTLSLWTVSTHSDSGQGLWNL